MILSKDEARREFERDYPSFGAPLTAGQTPVYVIETDDRFQATYRQFNPLEKLAEQEERDEMCLAHVRWIVKDGQCLTPEHKYDSKNKECRPISSPHCAAILRRYHNGEYDLAEVKRLLEAY